VNIYLKTNLFVHITSQISFAALDYIILTEHRQLIHNQSNKMHGYYNMQLIVAVFTVIITLMQISNEINCAVTKLIERAQDRVQ
jgi:hypothetical protein